MRVEVLLRALPRALGLLLAGIFSSAFAADAEPTLTEQIQGDVVRQVEKQVKEVEDAWNEDAFVRGIARIRHTGVFIDKMEKQVSDTGTSGVKVADVKTDTINTVSAGIVFLPNTKHIALTYTTAIGGGEGGGPGVPAEKVEEVRASFRPVDRVELSYESYKLNTFLTVLPGQTLLRIDRSNAAVENGFLNVGDAGLTVLTGGDTAGLRVERKRFEGRYYFEQAAVLGSPIFVGLFHETLTKPWSSRFEVWYDGPSFVGPTVGALYSEAKLVSNGISLGANIDPAKLKDGFNLQSAIFSASMLDIQLTDHYSLTQRLDGQGGRQAFKLALSGEVAYRKTFSSRMVGVASLFAGYDVNFVNMGHTNTSLSGPPPNYVNHLKGSWVALSSDVIYGASVSLMF